MSRQTRKTLEQMSTEQQALFHKIAKGRKHVEDGHIGGPFDSWILNPELGSRIVGLGNCFRFGLSVDRRQIEIAILVTGAYWKAQFEWYAHAPMALDAGVPQAVIDAIHAGERPDFDDADDAAAYALAFELNHERRVSDAVFAQANERFGEQGVAELTNLCGFYTMVSMTLNAFDVDLPEGVTPPFA